MAHGWTATKEALPPAGEKVLIISKWGHVSDGSLVAYDPKEPLLDEPAAGMNPNETEELMETIEIVRKRFGVTVLLIEHDMKLVSGICEYLYVLNFGRLLAEGTPKEVLSNPEVVKAYLGE